MKIIQNFLKVSRQFCTQSHRKHVQVCILGADTPTGRALSFILKQNPVISGLHLQGTPAVETMALDLNHFDTRSNVIPYSDANSVTNSLKCAHIVVMLGLNTNSSKMTLAKLVTAEGDRVINLAEACARYAPKAVVVVAVTPVSVTLPTAVEVYRQTDWYHPARLLGSAALAQIKANALAGSYQTLDPQIIHVPVIGGPDLDCALPLFPYTQPVGISQKDVEKLFKKFREEVPNPAMSHAVGLNRMLTGIALGLNGDYNADIVAFVRTNITSNCKHLVCTVKMGTKGIIHNYGLQKLQRNELLLLEEICEELKIREEMAHDLVHRKDKCSPPSFLLKEIEQEKLDETGIIRE